LNKGPLKESHYKPDGGVAVSRPEQVVGKTELAKAVAGIMFGDDLKMVRIDYVGVQRRHRSAFAKS
jgi:hypothetical protein